MADNLRSGLVERDFEQAITALKKGAHLLKYGRRGKPKFCPFKLSSDESALIWYSGKEERHVKLSQVLRITPGQRTATFQRYPRPEKEYQSFSLICSDRSLDLICKDKAEADVWFVALKALIARGNLCKPTSSAKYEPVVSENPSSPSTRTLKFSPFASPFASSNLSLQDPGNVSQAPSDNVSQNRLGKVFSDIVSLTAPINSNETEAAIQPPNISPTRYVESSHSRTSIAEPVRVSLSSVGSSSSHHSCREDSDALGDVLIWGEGISDGLLGGTRNSSSSRREDALLPRALESTLVLDVQNIACGNRHAVLVTKQGEIFSWGEESGGRLGHGIEADVPQPKLIDTLSGTNIELVACGEFHSCAVTVFGDLYTWGDGTHNSDMLGHGSEASYWVPKKVSGILEGLQVSHISCGPWHTAVVTSSGKLFTFGDGSFGILGHGDYYSTNVPREVETLRGLKTTRVACGVWHTAAVVEVITKLTDSELSSSGKLFTWGDGNKGQLGHGGNEPKLIPQCVTALEDENICQVACGYSLTVALTSAGRVYTMGSSAYGQLGNPAADGKIPTWVEAGIANSSVDEIACGAYHVAILTSSSEIYTWGKGSNGQLGHGNTRNRNTPTLVEFLKDRQAKTVACRSNITAVICLHKWVSSSDHSICAGCRNPFNFRRKRHNCYNCGLLFCKVCTSRKSLKAALAPDMNKPYRVCFNCSTKLKISTDSSLVVPFQRAKIGYGNRKSIDQLDKETFGSSLLSHRSSISSADSFMQAEVRSLRRDSRSELKDSPCSTATNRYYQLGGLHSQKELASSVESPKKLLLRIASSGMSSHTTSPVSGKSSPPRYSEVTVDDSKQINDGQSPETASLRVQVEELTQKSQFLEEELEKTRTQLKEVTALAGDEAEECRSAKELIKSLTATLKEMSDRLLEKVGTSSNSNSTASDTSNTRKQLSNESHTRSTVSHNNENHTRSTVSHNNENHTRSMVSPNNEPDGNTVSQTLANGNKAQTERAERVVQDEPGVYLTLLTLPSGGNELKRIRFSRKHFTEENAEKWWAENGGKVWERHNIRVKQ